MATRKTNSSTANTGIATIKASSIQIVDNDNKQPFEAVLFDGDGDYYEGQNCFSEEEAKRWIVDNSKNNTDVEYGVVYVRQPILRIENDL